ncbi:hypothetical protein BY996DRAFT_7049276 [Phakopsora pachyrhizi]|nr:hypothetical protein BY996DRAFT_7049276 [Phakopsora pachyrhizi]
MPFTEMPPEMLKQILETKLDEAVAKPWLDRNLQGTHIIKTFRSQKVDYFAKIQETNVIFNRLNKMIIDETSQRDLELIAFIVKKDMVTRLNLSLMENVLDHLKTLRYKYQFSKKFGSYYEYTNQLYLHLLSRMGACELSFNLFLKKIRVFFQLNINYAIWKPILLSGSVNMVFLILILFKKTFYLTSN